MTTSGFYKNKYQEYITYNSQIVANPDIRIAECDLQSLGIMKIYRTTES
jgi:hypothetical protein